jgi:hypothetical protein
MTAHHPDRWKLRFCCAAPALMYDKCGLLKIVEEDGVRSRALVRGDHV